MLLGQLFVEQGLERLARPVQVGAQDGSKRKSKTSSKKKIMQSWQVWPNHTLESQSTTNGPDWRVHGVVT
jgi:hypothetical protein